MLVAPTMPPGTNSLYLDIDGYEVNFTVESFENKIARDSSKVQGRVLSEDERLENRITVIQVPLVNNK